jgi:hypothetical protein
MRKRFVVIDKLFMPCLGTSHSIAGLNGVCTIIGLTRQGKDRIKCFSIILNETIKHRGEALS